MKVRKHIEIDAGHRVPLHDSKCKSLHGHRYRIEVEVDGSIPEDGMVKDFGILKALLVEHVHDPWDHAMLLQSPVDSFLIWWIRQNGWKVAALPFPPTAENLAGHIADTLAPILEADDITLTRVAVWETPTCSAVWEAA